MGRLLAVGDIHGCSRALDTLLELVAPGPRDLIVTLGDYVDRGPDSAGVLDRLVRLHAAGRLVALRGNHEQMMLSARDDPHGPAADEWLAVGGDATLASYRVATPSDVPAAHWAFIEDACADYHETDTHLFVHANAYPDLPLAEQPEYMLKWESFGEDTPPHESGKVMVCGHTPQKSGAPRSLGHAVCIDTWACGRGRLTCLDTTSGQYWQADQRGLARSGWIDECE